MSNKPRQKLDPKKFTPSSESQPKKDRDWTYEDILRSKSRRRGFTLMEIIIVTMIAGVLASIGFVNYSMVIEKSKAHGIEQNLWSLYAAEEAYNLEYGQYDCTGTKLGIEMRQPDYGVLGGFACGSGSIVVFGVRLPGTYSITYNCPWGSASTGQTALYGLTIGRNAGQEPTVCCGEGKPGICAKLGY
ncbi:MAG: type II secretion system protein [Candidatus Omnitrophica bacterium]|nr:type II secretion system protein [Candidatus Omnitrophota bacterium]